MAMESRVVLLVALSLLKSATSDAPADKVVNLPGLNFKPNFDHYSGFLQASPTHFFHYWFMRSQKDPVNDPVILWLNGGPGCSSIGGSLEELGPFYIKDYGNTVYENPYAWNKVGNVLFLSSPSGVGYSYATDGNLATGDDEVALDNYNALLNFFKTKFPELRQNDFYITGESYAGIYLPTLGVLIAKDKENFPNFKGMAIGNGMLSYPLNYNTMVPLIYDHAYMRQSLFDAISEQCCDGNPYKCNIFAYMMDPTHPCFQLIVGPLTDPNGIDPYNIYNQCYLDEPIGSKRNHIRTHIHRHINTRGKKPIRKDSLLPLCAQTNNTEIYMNRADVRAALHIPSLLPHWVDCSDEVARSFETTHFEMSPEVNAISDAGIKILIYNGDVDAVCNAQMNAQFLASLNRPVVDGSGDYNKPWFYYRKAISVAGLVTQYAGGIDFVTVRGAGHFVPEDCPKESLQMIYNWIKGKDYSVPADL